MNNDLIKKRLSKTHFVGRILARLPFVRCVILNGSLAQGKSKESSDIDILIIAKAGRIFSARFFVNAFTTILRVKRSKDERRDRSGKFCFNYFLTENFLKIPTGRGEKIDRYCAQNYSQSKYIAGDIDLFDKFILVNQDLFEKYNCHPKDSFVLSSSGFRLGSRQPRPMTRGSRKFGTGFRIKSGMTSLGFANWFEQKVKSYQIKKIESDPRTKKYPDLIVYSDRELRFHPPKSELRIKN